MKRRKSPLDLIIVGASGMGREVYDLCRRMSEYGKRWRIKGFLDSRADILKGLGEYPPILGDPDSHQVQSNELFVCAVGDSAWRLKYARSLRSRGANFFSILPPESCGSHAQIGEGCIFYPGSGVGPNTVVGDFVFLNSYSGVGHDSRLGDGVTIGPQVCVGGWAAIGEAATVGTHATILPHAVVGDHALVGAGSVVLKKVPPRTKVFGNPAVPIGPVDDDGL